MYQINEFAAHNDTDKWAVCVDGLFGLFASRAEAEEVYSLIGGTGGDDGLAETPFGSAALLPPHYVCRYYDGSEPPDGFDRISNHKPIDIKNYIIQHRKRAEIRSELFEIASRYRPAKERHQPDIYDLILGGKT